MAEMERERQQHEAQKKKTEIELKEIQTKLSKGDGNVDELQKKLTELETKSNDLKISEQDLKKKEEKAPWNVDTISKPGFAKTVINKKLPRQNDDDLTEEEKEQKMKKFINDNDKLLKKYGMLKKFDDSKRFLTEHHQLVCEDTANYLVIWCLNLEMEKKSDLMAHVAHQCICMQFILELAKQMDIDPRGCVSSFFTRIQVAEKEYKEQFENEIKSFKERIKARAVVKIQEAIAAQEEEERQARLGPGGLDPAEVFDTLPESLQKCFESRDIGLLQETIKNLPEEEAKYHMKRCVDSGLWLPEANKSNDEEDGGAVAAENDEIYDEIPAAAAATSDKSPTQTPN